MPGLPVEVVNPFIESTVHTLEVQCHCPARRGEIYRIGDQMDLPIDIAGVIGIRSVRFGGSITIGFPAGTFLAIMGRMLGEEYREIDDGIRDGAGELVNIIYGGAKTKLDDAGMSLEKALPSIVSGSNLSVTAMRDAQGLVVPFESDCGPLQITTAIQE